MGVRKQGKIQRQDMKRFRGDLREQKEKDDKGSGPHLPITGRDLMKANEITSFDRLRKGGKKRKKIGAPLPPQPPPWSR